MMNLDRQTTLEIPRHTHNGIDSPKINMGAENDNPRVLVIPTIVTLTPETNSYDIYDITALASNITIANHIDSSPADGILLEIRLCDNGTARTITFGTEYVAKAGVDLPTTTVISKNMEMLFEWNQKLLAFNLLAVGEEA